MIQKNNSNSPINKFLKNKIFLITGGAGSVGVELTKKLLEFPVKQIRILDINEHALFRLNRSINDKRLRLLLGNIQNQERIEIAGDGVDIIIHTAAIKNIEISEFNPIETIETNIGGTVNLIKFATKNKPKLFLNISTDKAANPSTLYGSTKQIGEKLTSWAGMVSAKTRFGTMRFANVFETRGNVFEVWEEELSKNKPLSITDLSMKRYFFSVNEATDFILKSLTIINNGEIIVPQMKLYNIKDLAKKYSKNHKIIGLRRGEKLQEVLLTNEEKKRGKKKGEMWIIKQFSN